MKVNVIGQEHVVFSTGMAARVEITRGVDGGWTVCAYSGEKTDLDQEPSLMLETVSDKGVFVTEESEAFTVEDRQIQENLSEEERTLLLTLIEKAKGDR